IAKEEEQGEGKLVEVAFSEREGWNRTVRQVGRIGATGGRFPIPATDIGLEPGQLRTGALVSLDGMPNVIPAGIAVAGDVAVGDPVGDTLIAELMHQAGVEGGGIPAPDGLSGCRLEGTVGEVGAV